jgi:tetratricopeptide (TPR) repeat protein
MFNFPLEKISLSMIPEHIFVKYKIDNNNHINFETMFENWNSAKNEFGEFKFKNNNKDPFVLDKEYILGASDYFKKKRISEKLIKNNIYLNFLNNEQLISKSYVICANSLKKLKKIKSHKKALEYYEKAMALDSNDPLPYFNCAELLTKLSKRNKKKWYKPYFNCDELLTESKKVRNYKKALKYYEKAIQLYPNNPISYFNCADLLAHSKEVKNHKKALEYYKLFIEKAEPNHKKCIKSANKKIKELKEQNN